MYYTITECRKLFSLLTDIHILYYTGAGEGYLICGDGTSDEYVDFNDCRSPVFSYKYPNEGSLCNF